MPLTRRIYLPSILAVAGLGAALLVPPGPVASAASAAGVSGPALTLEAAQRSVTLDRFGGLLYPDAGIWLAAHGSPLQFDLRREPYTSPITITQVIHPPQGGTITRPLPSRLLDGWNGLQNFLTLTIRNSAGQVVKSQPVALCPNSPQPERAGPGAPQNPLYPPLCGADPFVKSMVWGIQKDWAIDPAYTDQLLGLIMLPLGRYPVHRDRRPPIPAAIPRARP